MKKLTPEEKQKEPQTADEFRRALEVDVLARTIWGEARGEGSAGMQAVAAVILNRVAVAEKKGGYWWGESIVQVCQKPYQFSCWNKDDPNLRKLLSVDSGDIHFATAQRIAARAVTGLLDDPTNGATHYHTAGVTPAWSQKEKPVAVIGKHIFFRLEG